MEIGQLEAFDRVARDGNFTRAALTMGLTQPAVSTRVNLLEMELGGKLFERRGRQLVLTPLGERFLPYAQRILALRDDALQAAEDLHAGISGQVKLAAPTPLLLSYLVDTLVQYRRHNPTVDILIRERNKTTIFQLLMDNALTLGMVYAPVFDQNMTQLARFRDPIVPVVGTEHPLARHTDDWLQLEDLYEHTIFRVSMFPQMSAFIDSVVEHARQGSGGAVLAVPMVMARRLVLMGQGMTFLPASYVRPLIETGNFRQLRLRDMPTLNSEPVVIAHKNRGLDAAHTGFLTELKTRWRHLLVE